MRWIQILGIAMLSASLVKGLAGFCVDFDDLAEAAQHARITLTLNCFGLLCLLFDQVRWSNRTIRALEIHRDALLENAGSIGGAVDGLKMLAATRLQRIRDLERQLSLYRTAAPPKE